MLGKESLIPSSNKKSDGIGSSGQGRPKTWEERMLLDKNELMARRQKEQDKLRKEKDRIDKLREEWLKREREKQQGKKK